MFENRRMPNGMSERARSRGHAVWEGVPCKGALYPILVAELPGLEGSLPVAHRMDVHTRHPGDLCIADAQGKKEARDLPFMLGMLRQSRVHGSLCTRNFSCWISLAIMWETIVQKRLRLSGVRLKNHGVAFVFRAHCG